MSRIRIHALNTQNAATGFDRQGNPTGWQARLTAYTPTGKTDSTTEQSAYDPDGDLTIWTNRGGYSVVRCWDVLNRKVSEAGITGATNTGSCPTGGTSNLTARGWDLQTGTFTYDLAGRLTAASSARLNMTWAYDAAGRPTGRGGNWTTHYVWDGAGNMTGVLYSDGSSVFNYAYDPMNRTTAALQGTTTLASLTYDALGRRNVLTFHDASTQTWGYDAADRVTSIAHVFPNTPDNVTLTYGYDPSDREVSHASSNSAYDWSPASASVPYAAANALNQYPSVNAYAYTYWPEGPLEQTDTYKAYHDELNRFTFAYITATPGTVDPNDYLENTIDPLGHLMFHERHPANGVAYPYFYHSTDGLRPETVLDWQYTQPVTGGGVYQGVRRYVLGPNPDERWAFLDFDANNTIYYPHTDRQGTTIALSAAGAAAQKYQYDGYGQSTNTLTEIGPGSASYAFRYTGQRLDGGSGLYDYKARFYSPAIGRFLQPDPLGIEQGPNQYLYVTNDPVNGIDPSGEVDSSCTGTNISGVSCADSASPVASSGTVQAGTTQNGAGALQPKSQQAPSHASSDQPFGGVNGIGRTIGGAVNGLARWTVGTVQEVGGCFLDPGCGGPAAIELGTMASTARAVGAVESFAAARIGEIQAEIESWIGPAPRAYMSKQGNLILESADGTKRFRLDFSQRQGKFGGPHAQFEERSSRGVFKPLRDVPPHVYFNGP